MKNVYNFLPCSRYSFTILNNTKALYLRVLILCHHSVLYTCRYSFCYRSVLYTCRYSFSVTVPFCIPAGTHSLLPVRSVYLQVLILCYRSVLYIYRYSFSVTVPFCISEVLILRYRSALYTCRYSFPVTVPFCISTGTHSLLTPRGQSSVEGGLKWWLSRGCKRPFHREAQIWVKLYLA